MHRESRVVNKHFITSQFRAACWCRVVLFRQNVLMTKIYLHEGLYKNHSFYTTSPRIL